MRSHRKELLFDVPQRRQLFIFRVLTAIALIALTEAGICAETPGDAPGTDNAKATLPSAANESFRSRVNTYHPDVAQLLISAEKKGLKCNGPHLISMVQPKFPKGRRKITTKVVVWVDFVVDTDGETSEIGFALDDDPLSEPDFAAAAEEAIKGWRFEPGRIDGKLAEYLMVVPVVFQPSRGRSAIEVAFENLKLQQDYPSSANDSMDTRSTESKVRRQLFSRFPRELAVFSKAYAESRVVAAVPAVPLLEVLSRRERTPDTLEVCVSILIDTQGRVSAIEALPVVPAPSDDPRIVAVRTLVASWRYHPVILDGTPIDSEVTFAICSDGQDCWREPHPSLTGVRPDK